MKKRNIDHLVTSAIYADCVVPPTHPCGEHAHIVGLRHFCPKCCPSCNSKAPTEPPTKRFRTAEPDLFSIDYTPFDSPEIA